MKDRPLNRRSKLPQTSGKVAFINDRRPVPVSLQGSGRHENITDFLLGLLLTVVGGAVSMRWAIAALIVLFIGTPDLHDAIVSWALVSR